jgi:prepilin-type N-terminal cleavage/methylation domain-containing protein
MGLVSRPRVEAGFTLVEAMVALSLFALLAALALPRVESTIALVSVKSARTAAATRFQIARTIATHGNRTAIVRISGGSVWVEARPRTVPVAGSTVDTIGLVAVLDRDHGVTVWSTLDSVVYGPRALATSGGTLGVYRGPHRDSLLVTAVGMVTR